VDFVDNPKSPMGLTFNLDLENRLARIARCAKRDTPLPTVPRFSHFFTAVVERP
jgi:hypothetical protein